METIEAVVTPEGVGTVHFAGQRVQVAGPGDLATARGSVLAAVNDAVRSHNASCRLVITDQGQRHVFDVHPDGSRVAVIEENPAPAAREEASEPRTAEPAPLASVIEDVPTAASFLPQAPAAAAPVAFETAPTRVAPPAPPAPVTEQPASPAPAAEAAPIAGQTRRSLREVTFLTSDDAEAPAAKGPRALLRFVGIKPQPSAAELAEREDTRTVSQHWPGPRTIAVVNRKGGSNKTPTVAALSAVFARNGGGGVLAWDNNENQGTLGWRTEQGHHGASVLDLLRDETRLMSPTASQGLMAGYVHHQGSDKYDVLRSDENDQGDHEIQADEVHRAHAIAERYYRLIIMDSGNTARAANWRAMIEHTDQLVVPTTTMEDRAEAARSLLVTLEDRDEHSAQLSANAVVIISQWKADDGPEAQRIAGLFQDLGRTVVTVPFDPALKAGRIRYEALRPATQRAWLAAAAAVGRGL